jgi:LPS export ABC transporter protein LptC
VAENTQTAKNLEFRANLPKYFRLAAIGIFALAVIGIGIGFYSARNVTEFRMIGFPTSLSKDVVAQVNGYERRESEGDIVKYYIKADKATTFSDNHQEMENVYLQVFDPTGAASDQITAVKAVYIPEEDKNFTAYFAGNVNIQTRDSLKVKTEQVTYKKETETASADEQVDFERENIRGRSFGAVVKVVEKRLELLRDVDIQTFESPELAKSNVEQSHIKSGYAVYDQLNEKIELQQSVHVTAVRGTRTADVQSDRANVFLVASETGGRDVSKIELFDNVLINTQESNGRPTKISSGYALYQRQIDRFDLKNDVNIVTVEDEKPTVIKSANAVYEQAARHIQLNGEAEVTQGNDYVKGDEVAADLYPSKKLKNAAARGNAYIRQAAADRTTEIAAAELNAAFNDNQQLTIANSLGGSNTILTPTNKTDYSKVTLSAPRAIHAFFKGEGLFDKIVTDGRTTIQLDVPDTDSDSANKKVTADSVKTFFNADGKDISRAEAIGDAELLVEPLKATPTNYRTTINAPRFDCEFFPTGNNAKQCVATTKTRTVRVPTVKAPDRENQVIVADRLTANFNQGSKDIESVLASGGAKFTEGERNAISSEITFTANDETVRLRGAEPTAWDSTARAKAREIDWNTREQRSYLRGNVSTTYYSQKQTSGAAPFGDTDKPVFLTSDNAEFDHKNKSAVYTGGARGWQENNFVRADKFFIQEPQGMFFADGSVSSLLYDAKRKEDGKTTTVPVYASSQKMSYNRDSRVLHYENNVDIRQGTDRITGGVANVFLSNGNEVSRTDVENSVVVTQPNRKATGDFAQYITADEVVVLRGNPARVDDAENGSSSGAQLTVYLKQNRVVGEGKTNQNTTGRTRSVYKVKNN